MKCKYCQAEIDNDSVFCPVCGKKLSEPKPRPHRNPTPKPAPPKRQSDGNKKNIWWLLLMALLLCIGAYFLFFHSCEGNKKNNERIEANDEDVREVEDSIYQAKAAMEQQQIQDSLLNVAKTKADSLAYIKDSLKNVQTIKDEAAKSTPARTARQKSSDTRRSTASVPVVQRESALVVGTKNYSYGTFRGTLKNGLPHDISGRMIFKSAHIIDSRDPKGRVADPGDYVIGEFADGHLVQGIWYGEDRQVKGSIIIGK